jgi:sugar phosphate isomerase/epimerase
LFLKTLKKIGYSGPMSIEREAGSQQDRFNDILQAVEYLRVLDV